MNSLRFFHHVAARAVTVAAALALSGCAFDGSPGASGPADPAPAQRAAAPANAGVQLQLDAASRTADDRAFVQALNASGIHADLRMGVARRMLGDGSIAQFPATRATVLHPLPPDHKLVRDKALADAIRQLARRAASNDSEPQQIVANVTPGTRTIVTRWIDEGLASAPTRNHVDVQVFETRIVRNTVVFAQALKQDQFVGGN